MWKIVVVAAVAVSVAGIACAQDIPGVENCSAEKTMERRTGCLQSDVNYLYQLIGKNAADAQQKLSAANNEVVALKAAVAQLRGDVALLQAAAKKAEDAKKPEAAKPK